jgi:P27 family predicted phage terminase small subunit
MPAGRKPKPTALRLIQGNPGKRAISKDEPKPVAIAKPRAPVALGVDAKKEWTRVTKQLADLGMVTAIDTSALAAYCIAFERFKNANAALEDVKKKDPIFKGLMVKTKQGNWIQNPLVGVARRAADDMIRYGSEFGMTPSSRSRLSIAPTEGKGEFDDF